MANLMIIETSANHPPILQLPMADFMIPIITWAKRKGLSAPEPLSLRTLRTPKHPSPVIRHIAHLVSHLVEAPVPAHA